MVMTASLPAGKCRELWKEMREMVLWDQGLSGEQTRLELGHHFRWALEILVLSGVGAPVMVCALAWQHQPGDSEGREVTSLSPQLSVEQR